MLGLSGGLDVGQPDAPAHPAAGSSCSVAFTSHDAHRMAQLARRRDEMAWTDPKHDVAWTAWTLTMLAVLALLVITHVMR